jgi:hypothetical protein
MIRAILLVDRMLGRTLPPTGALLKVLLQAGLTRSHNSVLVPMDASLAFRGASEEPI